MMHHPIGADTLDEAIERAAGLLRAARRVAVLTGAGISAESGLATFRGAGGLWEGHRVEDVATPRAFAADPGLVWRFYNLRRANLATVKPNPGHFALADLEKRLEDGFTLITQNVDGLHQGRRQPPRPGNPRYHPARPLHGLRQSRGPRPRASARPAALRGLRRFAAARRRLV
jgi:hypothetical protein